MKKESDDYNDLSAFHLLLVIPAYMIFQFVFYIVQFCVWYFASWVNIARRIITPSFTNKVGAYKYKSNTVTIDGIFSPIPWYTRETFSTRFENTWSPRIGFISCVKDRACEAIYDMLGERKVNYIDKLNHSASKSFTKNRNFLSNTLESLFMLASRRKSGDAPRRPDLRNKVNILCYSAGVPTFNQMLIYIHENNIGYIKEKKSKGVSLTQREIEIYNKVSDINNKRYKPHFPCIKEDGNGTLSVIRNAPKKQLSPDIFDRIVYISPPFCGVEWVSEGINLDETTQKYSTYSLSWFISLLICIYYNIVGDTEGYIISPYLGQYSENFYEFINNGRNLAQDMANVKTLEKNSVEAMKIIEMYGLKSIRVITSASTKVGNNYYFRPDSELNIYLYWFLGSRLFKIQHDGVVSLESQLFGLKCSCVNKQCFDSVSKCDKCNSIICPVDHTSIVFRNYCDEKREEAWNYINLFLEGRSE